MILKNSNDYYTTDQSIKSGDLVMVWNGPQLQQDSMVLKIYNRYDPITKEHVASNMIWKSAVRVTEPVELDPGEVDPVPVPVSGSVERYGDVWARAYISSGNEATADDTLAVYRVKESQGDFDAKAVAVDPIP